MRCPKIHELPPVPAGKTGWPWTEESRQLPEKMSNNHPWPKLTVVTPSMNQGQYIEAAIRSVLLQGYPNLEYFVLDGGSSDDSVKIIKKYEPWISYWCSEKDSGQSDAINRGLKRGSGFYATWINSDDMLHQNALFNHASRIGFENQKIYVGDCAFVDENGKFQLLHRANIHSLEDLLRIGTVWRSGGHIVQPEVIFPLKNLLSCGGVNLDNHYCMDYELWGNLLLTGCKFQYTGIPFGISRDHSNQKTKEYWQTTKILLETAVKLVKLADTISGETKTEILSELESYRLDYVKHGRLAKLGLSSHIIIAILNLRDKLKSGILTFTK